MAIFVLILSAAPARSQVLAQPYTGQQFVDAAPEATPPNFHAQLTVYPGCQAGNGPALSAAFPAAPTVFTTGYQHIPLTAALVNGETVCVVENYTYVGPAQTPTPTLANSLSGAVTTQNAVPPAGASAHLYDGVCRYAFNDCDWTYSLVGGVEQSDLSSQNSQTDPWVDLIVRAPVNVRLANVWLRARFLGSPTNSSTQNVVAAATNPTGTLTSSSLSTVGSAVDYVVGVEHDWFLPASGHPDGGMFTLGAIAGFGATSPLSSQSATTAYAVPAYGTNECNQLLMRFGPGNHNGYSPFLPAGGTFITTTTVGSNSPTTTTSSDYCSLQNTPTTSSTTSNGVTTTTTISGTPITNIAFSPQDRSSMLLKYVAGIRLINRWHAANTERCSSRGANDHMQDAPGTLPLTNGPCTRSIVDFTIGQDQAITGGYLRKFVFKSDAIFPIPGSGIYFFATAAIRLRSNQNLPPLILTSTPIATTSGTPTVGAVTIPSPSVFVLPLKQSDRDFYRIGIALDLSKILPKLFAPL